jgi:hypothetical protein
VTLHDLREMTPEREDELREAWRRMQAGEQVEA